MNLERVDSGLVNLSCDSGWDGASRCVVDDMIGWTPTRTKGVLKFSNSTPPSWTAFFSFVENKQK